MAFQLSSIVSTLTGGLFKIVDKFIPDKDLALKIKQEIQSEYHQFATQQLEAATQVIVSEAKGESWLQRNWRPLTMLTFTGLIVMHWLGWTAENLTEAEIVGLLDIVKIGLGGYVVGRSVEKAVKEYKK